MKRGYIFFSIFFTAVMLSLSACTDPKSLLDQNTEVANHNWAYQDRVKFTVKIDDEKIPYNLFVNLRITADYKYSNMFVLVTQIGPDKKADTKRYEIPLANKDGEWLGKGSGNLYSYQYPFLSDFKFAAKGVYTFEIEQNMRDNPLKEVSDVGLKVEKGN
jgi:gliding motility-associated lipoprotein GldH